MKKTLQNEKPGAASLTALEQFFKLTEGLIDGVERVIRGKRCALELLVTSLIAGGHVLIEDLPGLGKTTLAKSVARLISNSQRGGPVIFRRIQFTPDLLPYDITGVDVFDPKSRKFVFLPGPVFTNVLLADEINRTTPKVQSALLEVMAESQVTVGNKTYDMEPLFFVIATQNPVETEGTYPLPLAQIDRFLMKITLGYPNKETEFTIVRDDPAAKVLPIIKSVCSKRDVLKARAAAETIFCDERLIQAVVALSAATRRHRGVELGCSPRASLMLIKSVRAYALVKGRNYCIDQDLIDLAPAVMAHRLRLKDVRIDPAQLVREIVLDELSRINY